MKKTRLFILALAFLWLFAAPQQAQAQYCSYGVAYGISWTWQDTNYVYGYAATELDYCAGLYYDPAVYSRFVEGNYRTENTRVLGDGYSEGYADWVPAEVFFGYGYPRSYEYYNTDSRHYVLEYYQYYACFTYCGYYWYDPWGWGFTNEGYGGPNYYGYGGPGYWSVRRRMLGMTIHTIIFQPPDPCQPGQNFTSTGTPCSTPTPTPTPTVTPTPTPEPTPRATVTEVGFKGDHALHTWAGGNAASQRAIDASDGSEPTWKQTGNPNYPVAYTRGARPTIFATLSVSSVSNTNTTMDIRVKKGGSVIATKSGVPTPNGNIRVNDIAVSANLESVPAVQISAYTFDWEVSFDGGQNWSSAGSSGSHKVYWTFAAPLNKPFKNTDEREFSEVYDRALEIACTAAGGLSNSDMIIAAINADIDRQIYYDPAFTQGNVNPLVYYDLQRCLCADNANLLRGLLRSIGIDGTTYYVWGGSSSGDRYRYNHRISSTLVNQNVTLRAVRNAHDGAAASPHFSYHAVVQAGSNNATTGQPLFFDPSYGISAQTVELDETFNLPARTFNLGDSAASNRVLSLTYAGSGQALSLTPPAYCPHSVPAARPRNASPFITQSVPFTMVAGESYYVSVTMRNDGEATWTEADGYRLGSQNPQDSFTWGMNRVTLPQSVAPDAEVTFTFLVTAPSTPGTYNFQWRMVQDGVEWFGDYSTNVAVTVSAPAYCDYYAEQDCYNRGGDWDSSNCQCYVSNPCFKCEQDPWWYNY